MRVVSDFGLAMTTLRAYSVAIRQQWELDNFDATPHDADIVEKLTAQVKAQTGQIAQLSRALDSSISKHEEFQASVGENLQRMGDLLLDLTRAVKGTSGSPKRKRNSPARTSASSTPSPVTKKTKLMSTEEMSPSTGCPEYSDMNPFVLKGELKKIGMSAGTKAYMVRKLTDVFEKSAVYVPVSSPASDMMMIQGRLDGKL